MSTQNSNNKLTKLFCYARITNYERGEINMAINFNDIPDLSFGLPRYTAAKADLEGVIEKISTLFNIL